VRTTTKNLSGFLMLAKELDLYVTRSYAQGYYFDVLKASVH